MPTLIPLWIQFRYSPEETRLWVQEYYPDSLFIYSNWICSGFYDEILLKISLILAITQIFFIGGLIVYYAIKSIRLLSSVKNSLKASTYSLQKQFLVVLCLQAIIPIVCLVAPTTILFVAMLMRTTNMSGKYSIL